MPYIGERDGIGKLKKEATMNTIIAGFLHTGIITLQLATNFEGTDSFRVLGFLYISYTGGIIRYSVYLMSIIRRSMTIC